MQMTGACDKRAPTAKLSAPCQAAKAKSYIWKLLANAREKAEQLFKLLEYLKNVSLLYHLAPGPDTCRKSIWTLKKKCPPQCLIMLCSVQ